MLDLPQPCWKSLQEPTTRQPTFLRGATSKLVRLHRTTSPFIQPHAASVIIVRTSAARLGGRFKEEILVCRRSDPRPSSSAARSKAYASRQHWRLVGIHHLFDKDGRQPQQHESGSSFRAGRPSGNRACGVATGFFIALDRNPADADAHQFGILPSMATTGAAP